MANIISRKLLLVAVILVGAAVCFLSELQQRAQLQDTQQDQNVVAAAITTEEAVMARELAWVKRALRKQGHVLAGSNPITTSYSLEDDQVPPSPLSTSQAKVEALLSHYHVRKQEGAATATSTRRITVEQQMNKRLLRSNLSVYGSSSR